MGMGFDFVTRQYRTLEALVGYLESLSAFFSCAIGTVTGADPGGGR